MSIEEVSANSSTPASKKSVRFYSDVSIAELLYSSSSESSEEDVPAENEVDEANEKVALSEPIHKKARRYTEYLSRETEKLGTPLASEKTKRKIKEQKAIIHQYANESKKNLNSDEIHCKMWEMSAINSISYLTNSNSLLDVLDVIVKYSHFLSLGFEPATLVTLAENIAKGKQYKDIENGLKPREKEIAVPNYPKGELRGKILDAYKRLTDKLQISPNSLYLHDIEEITSNEEFFQQLVARLQAKEVIALEKAQKILAEKFSTETMESVIIQYLQEHPGIMCYMDNATLEHILKFRIDRTCSLVEISKLIRENAYIFYRLGETLIQSYSFGIYNLKNKFGSVEDALDFITPLGGLREKCKLLATAPSAVKSPKTQLIPK